MRGAKGLSEGELNVNYIAPIGFSARYGINDNLEARTTLAGELPYGDLFFHTNNREENAFNAGVAVGGNLISLIPNQKGYVIFTGLTVGYNVSQHIEPYISCEMYLDSEDKDDILMIPTLGCDFRIPIRESNFSLLLTPQFALNMADGELYTHNLFYSGNVGLIYNFSRGK